MRTVIRGLCAAAWLSSVLICSPVSSTDDSSCFFTGDDLRAVGHIIDSQHVRRGYGFVLGKSEHVVTSWHVAVAAGYDKAIVETLQVLPTNVGIHAAETLFIKNLKELWGSRLDTIVLVSEFPEYDLAAYRRVGDSTVCHLELGNYNFVEVGDSISFLEWDNSALTTTIRKSEVRELSLGYFWEFHRPAAYLFIEGGQRAEADSIVGPGSSGGPVVDSLGRVVAVVMGRWAYPIGSDLHKIKWAAITLDSILDIRTDTLRQRQFWRIKQD